jgi:ABC-2 type transport system permease protein
VFTALFLVVLFWFSFNLNGMIANLAANAQQAKESLAWALPLVWMAEGLLGDWGKLLAFLVCCVATFAIVAIVLGAVYRKAVSAFQAKSARSDYRLSRQQGKGQVKALLVKEAKRFFGTPGYFWNGALGLIFLLVLGVLALVRREVVLSFAGMLPVLPVAGVAIGFCLSTCIISSPSVSLEGRNFWILREAPVSEARLVWAKTGFQIILAAPCTLFAVVCLSVATALPLWQGVVLALFVCDPFLEWYLSLLG